MESLTSLVIPAAVFVIMWIVGLELSPADFRRVARCPAATMMGTAGQLACPPLVASLLILFLRGLSILLVFGVVTAVVVDQRAVLVESVRSVAALAAMLTISVMRITEIRFSLIV